MRRFWIRGDVAGVCAGDPPDVQTNGQRAGLAPSAFKQMSPSTEVTSI
jgi:hypothetical protein